MRSLVILMIFAISTTVLAAENPASCQADKTSAYIPSYVSITKPAADVPSKYAKWSGSYLGHFDGSKILCTRLFVTTVEADGSVEVTYVWGKHPRFSPGDTDARTTIDSDGGILSFTMGNGRTNKYQMNKDDSLSVVSDFEGSIVSGTLDRAP